MIRHSPAYSKKKIIIYNIHVHKHRLDLSCKRTPPADANVSAAGPRQILLRETKRPVIYCYSDFSFYFKTAGPAGAIVDDGKRPGTRAGGRTGPESVAVKCLGTNGC